MAYLHDVAILLKAMKEHFCYVAETLRISKNAHVLLELRNCDFLCITVTYLGHVIKPQKLKLSSWVFDSMKEVLARRKKPRATLFLRVV